jgi:hypothetical protein
MELNRHPYMSLRRPDTVAWDWGGECRRLVLYKILKPYNIIRDKKTDGANTVMVDQIMANSSGISGNVAWMMQSQIFD